MYIDDPKKPEFASWRSYREFAARVKRVRRYVWDPDVHAFLETVLATLKDRDFTIRKGTVLYRAQRGIRYEESFDNEDRLASIDVLGFNADRMTPLPDRASEGRINPAGISVLYLAS